MKDKISVVINTLNEERNIRQAILSVSWADEVIVCDMRSEDKTTQIAKQLGARVIDHARMGYVEPARNFAIESASYNWVLVLDADEETPARLASKLQEVASLNQADFVSLPRKNIIFQKWIKSCGWWPDENIRFFQKGFVVWNKEIHSQPQTKGRELHLAGEEMALVHHHYRSIFEYIERLNRYALIQAKELFDKGQKFHWSDLIQKPLQEFLTRFFAESGYKEGVHGLALSLLQACSFLIIYLNLWQLYKFKDQQLSLGEVKKEMVLGEKQIKYWFFRSMLSKNTIKRFLQRINHKLS